MVYTARYYLPKLATKNFLVDVGIKLLQTVERQPCRPLDNLADILGDPNL